MIYASARLRRAFRIHCVVFKAFLLAVCLNPQTALAALPNGTAFNGVIPGEFSVSPTGAATYSIPIEVPPGIGGMTPQLSLNYNSQAGNGLLGVGWLLGGLSAITRCPATLAQDGFIDGVDFDANDRFCLDGQRLVAVNGAYGANGTEYRTEIDHYSKIISYGQQGSGPAWFKVWTKAGLEMEYGCDGGCNTTSNSRVEASGGDYPTVLIWAVNKISDVKGNYASYIYAEDAVNSYWVLDSIVYSSNDVATLSATNSVKMVYENRPDVTIKYINKSKIVDQKRLKRVEVKGNGVSITNYDISYDLSDVTHRSRITAITQCVDNGSCRNSKNLVWQQIDGGITVKNNFVLTASHNWLDSTVVHPGDYNGDGVTDIYLLTRNGSYFCAGPGIASRDNCVLTSSYNWVDAVVIHPGDYDGNGNTDLYLLTKSGSYFCAGPGIASKDNCVKTSSYNWVDAVEMYPGDYNGDGQTDLYLLNRNGSYFCAGPGIASKDNCVKTSSFNWVDEVEVYPGDYNGDGQTDLYLLTQTKNYFCAGSGITLANNCVETVPYNLRDYYDIYPGDYNGDGHVDLYLIGQANNYFCAGPGIASTNNCVVTVPYNWKDYYAAYPGDYNGDGHTDLYLIGQSANYFCAGPGITLANNCVETVPYNLRDYYAVHPGDYNGDGQADLYLIGRTGNYFGAGASSLIDHVSKIMDSESGSFVSVNAEPLTNSTYYTKNNDASYPFLDLVAPLKVVVGTSVGDGVDSLRSSAYHYQSLKAHRQGRGLLGFGKVTITDDQTGILTATFYNQDFATSNNALDFPKIGAVNSVETSLNGALLSKSINTYSVTSPSTGRYQLFADISTAYTYELNGTLVSTVTTNNQQYDTYGNPQRIDVTSTGGNETYTKTTLNTYDNDTVQWHLGRLLSATVTSTGPPGTETRTSAFEYDNTTGLLTAEIIEPGDPQLMLRTEYSYDAYGNKTSVTVKDSGSNAYPLTTATSTTSYDYSQLAAGTYSITSTNAKGHSETQVIDARFGKPLNLIGPNLLTTQWQYDSFGRQVREIRADGTETSQSMVWCDSNCAGVPNAVYKVTSQTTGSAATSVYFDSLGRELRSEAVSLDGRMVYKDTQYNNLGQVTKISRPYFAGDTAQWANFLYDLIGRVWKETAPDGGTTETTYNGLTTSVRRYSTNDPYNQTSTRVNNVEGNLITVIDERLQTTTYAYDPFGNLKSVTDPANNVIVMAYDKRGRKTSMDDPDMGHWEYKYDASGQLRWQKNAKNQVVTMAYDVLGRMTSRVEPEGTSTWVYDTATKGKGKLHKVTGPNRYVETYRYDSKGRQDRVTNTIAGSTFNTTTTFDSAGRVNKLTYPSGFILQHLYNSNGYLNKVRNASNTSEVYWTAQESSPDGQITLEQLGNGLQTVRTFDPQSGRMTYLGTYAGSNNVQMLNYDYDAIGNLQSREDVNQNLTETFQYDEFNRLTQSTIAGVGTKTWAYDGLGNIQSKDGYSDYTYGTAGSKPHAVTTARGATYAYDTNGNMTSGAGRTITWNSDNKPTRITKGSTVVDFKYGPDRARYQQIKTTGGVTTTTLYVGKLYEQETKGGITLYKNYISAGGRTVAIRETVSGTSTMKYLHQDHLGSTDVITNASGQVQERSSFDAFGSRRVATTWHDPVGALTSLFSTRGFTGHEQLDDVGLIHMNGRVYDPALGRFLSADPYVKYPAGAQGLNRYSYTDNNPLSRVDPSGYGWFSDKWKSIKGAVKDFFSNPIVQAISAIVAAPWVGLYVGTTFGLSTAAGYALSGFSAGFIASGGNFKAGLFGAATGLAFYGVGNLAEAGRWGLSRTSLAHGVVGGASSVASGGRFKHGFMSGGFTSFSSPVIGTAPGGWVGRTVAAAVVGGTASELGGGKFANGAKSFAFLRLFGEAADYYRRKVRYDIDMGPGGDAVEKGLEGMPVEGANNAGTQGRWVYDSNGRRIIGFLEEGGPVSWLGNKLWGVNATAGFHDTLQISMGNSVWRDVLNVPGMAAAAGVTYSGFIGQAVNAVGPMMVPIRDDDRRGGYQWVMYAP